MKTYRDQGICQAGLDRTDNSPRLPVLACACRAVKAGASKLFFGDKGTQGISPGVEAECIGRDGEGRCNIEGAFETDHGNEDALVSKAQDGRINACIFASENEQSGLLGGLEMRNKERDCILPAFDYADKVFCFDNIDMIEPVFVVCPGNGKLCAERCFLDLGVFWCGGDTV